LVTITRIEGSGSQSTSWDYGFGYDCQVLSIAGADLYKRVPDPFKEDVSCRNASKPDPIICLQNPSGFPSEHGTMYNFRTLPAMAMLALIGLVAAEPAHMILCRDVNGSGDNCKQFDVPSAAFEVGASFVFKPEICDILGGCPSSVTLLASENVQCKFGSEIFINTCSGTTMNIRPRSG
jgi:hypothetical protein